MCDNGALMENRWLCSRLWLCVGLLTLGICAIPDSLDLSLIFCASLFHFGNQQLEIFSDPARDCQLPERAHLENASFASIGPGWFMSIHEWWRHYYSKNQYLMNNVNPAGLLTPDYWGWFWRLTIKTLVKFTTKLNTWDFPWRTVDPYFFVRLQEGSSFNMFQEMVWPKNPCRLRMYWHLELWCQTHLELYRIHPIPWRSSTY